MLIHAPHREAQRGFSHTTRKAPAMLLDTLPSALQSSSSNNGATAQVDPNQIAHLLELQTDVERHLAKIERLLIQMEYNQTSGNQQVAVSDVTMNFGDKVIFLVTWAAAAVPASLIFLTVTWFALSILREMLATLL